jgi:hypothetical protein
VGTTIRGEQSKAYLIPMAERAYSDAALSPDARRVEPLARWIIQTKATEVHVRHVQRNEHLSGLVTAADIHKACQALVGAGWLSAPPRGSSNGRARQAYQVTVAFGPRHE